MKITATGACQVWCWDVTFLRSPVLGLFYYLYLIVDLYSRKAVGWEVHESESGEHAAALVHRAVLAEQCVDQPMVLHADNGAIQKSYTLRRKLEQLGIEPSYSRPRVSDDNAYSEALFRTCKYRPDFPVSGFANIEAARHWVARFGALVQRRAPSQCYSLRHTGRAPSWRRARHPRPTRRAVRSGQGPTSRAMERQHTKLVACRSRVAQPGKASATTTEVLLETE